MALPVLGQQRRKLGRIGLLLLFLALLLAPKADAARLKDLASVKGVRSNQLIGYGLVVGLNGSGDADQTEFTVQSLVSMLARMGIGVNPEDVRTANVAAVMVTANLPPFARAGATIDTVVSSIGDATSLEGGTLVMTPLFAADGEVYAIAQGPLSVGGFAAGGGGGSGVQKNHPTVGRLAQGATVERELAFELAGAERFTVSLDNADFTTALRIADAVNRSFGSEVAQAKDPGTLMVEPPAAYSEDIVRFLALLESVQVSPDAVARVVLNERTGTVVMGERVTISTVAVSHGNLSVSVSVRNDVSQPAPFARVGETVEVQNTDVEATEDEARLHVVEGGVTIQELVQGLNAIGVTPRDLISILQAIKASGAMSAELEIL